MKKFYLVLIFCFFQLVIFAQRSLLYSDSSLPTVEITIDPAYLDLILAPGNEGSDEEYPADFTFTSTEFQATEATVGFRLRGNTSRASAKKSFKVSFNTFEKGRDLEGVEKLNLNGEHNDPSIIRSKICWDLLQQMGVAASRANHVKLYINNEYKGLYMNVEHVDEEFIENRFGNKTGNLYKCTYPANLNYIGENPDLYKETPSGRRTYELTINEDIDDYSGLANFIKVLNKTPAPNFEVELEKVFDVNSYLKILAVEVMTGHWDNYGFNQNNYYLYENPTDNKFYYLAFDLDNTLGVDFFGDANRTTVNMYEWYDKNQNRPLTKRIMQSQRYRALFSIYMEQLLEFYKPEVLFPRIDALKTMITSAAESDQYKALDWGFTNSTFNISYDAKPTNPDFFFVQFGLKEFITSRYENTLGQLVITGLEPISNWSFYPNPTVEMINLTLPFDSYTIQLLSIDGRLLFQTNFTGKAYSKDLREENLSDGIYFLKVTSVGKSPLTTKLIYNH